MEKTLNGLETEYISAVFGAFDENIEIIENECNVRILSRGDMVSVTGERENVEYAEKTLKNLFDIAKTRDVIDTQTVKYVMSLSSEKDNEDVARALDECICICLLYTSPSPRDS